LFVSLAFNMEKLSAQQGITSLRGSFLHSP
jgi:hypothetical protein